jgi:imidazolonepropionase-like amidohydrolase
MAASPASPMRAPCKWGGDVKHISIWASRTLLPGLIDMHVHLDSPADIGGYGGGWNSPTASGRWWRSRMRAPCWMQGFTTVRNVGSDNRNDVGLKQAIEAMAMPSARASCRRAMRWAATGGIATQTFLPPSLEKPARRKGVADSARTESALSGAPPAQIWRRGDQGLRDRRGVSRATPSPASSRFQRTDELRAIADEAHNGA